MIKKLIFNVENGLLMLNQNICENQFNDKKQNF
jgi:hypothetical protein